MPGHDSRDFGSGQPGASRAAGFAGHAAPWLTATVHASLARLTSELRSTPTDDTPLVAVVVVNWNGLDDTRECLRSLFAQTWPNVEIMVVDNGSANGEADTIEREFGDRVRLFRNAGNLGFTGGNNPPMQLAVAEGRARYVALLNNDAFAEPEWLARLVRAAQDDPDAGLFASHMVFVTDPERTENAGTLILTSGDAMPRGRGQPRAAFARSATLLGACGGAVLYRADLLRELGTFRDDFFANFEDVDLSLRAAAAGRFTRFVPGAVVRHRLNASIARVRDAAFDVRSVRNLSVAYWINMPRTVIALNAPWLILSWTLAPLFALLLGRLDLARALVRGRLRTFSEWRTISSGRRRLRSARRGNPLRIWWLQRSGLSACWQLGSQVLRTHRRRQAE
ncbi:MAG: glycosyltransferase family 2 protein [Planctomycetes bacterium]|nr:glycosyltransferase family 2 protein [Planctomycetota bacterium]